MRICVFILRLISKYKFYWLAFWLVVGLFSFHYWMAFPGLSKHDTPAMILLVKNGWHPALISWILQGIYALFGIHIYHLLLLCLIPFYLGIWILIVAVYSKIKSWWALFLCFPCFIANIYYLLLEMRTTSFSFAWVFLFYVITLYMVLLKPKKKTFFVFYGLIFIIALLSRHNAIFQVWPITFIWIGLYLQKKDLNLWTWLKCFIPLSIGSGFFLLLLLSLGSELLSVSDKGNTYPSTPTLMHQIVGACIPSMDESCFKADWWHKDWKDRQNKMLDLSKKYREHPLDADYFASAWKRDIPFYYYTDLKGRFSKFLYAIYKHPSNYLSHVGRYFDVMWFQKFVPMEQGTLLYQGTRKDMIARSSHYNPASKEEKEYRTQLAENIPESEFGIKWSDTQKEIDSIFRKYLPKADIILFIIANFVFFMMGGFLFIKSRKNLLLFATSSAFAGILTSVAVPLFVPVPSDRYMMPIVLCSIFAGTGIAISLRPKFINLIFLNLFKHEKLLFCLCCYICLIFPTLIYSKEEISIEENRTLSEFPQFFSEGKINQKFGLDFNDWLNDHMGLRKFLIGIRTQLMYKINGKIANEKAFMADDDWIFPTQGTKYVDSIETQRKKVDKAVGILNRLDQHIKNTNIPIYVVIVPDREKSLIRYWKKYYPMKKQIDIGEEIKHSLKQRKRLHIIYPKDVFTNSAHNLFLKNDLHLNGYGSANLLNELLKNMDIDFPKYNIIFSKQKDFYYSNLLQIKQTGNDYDKGIEILFSLEPTLKKRENHGLYADSEILNPILKKSVYIIGVCYSLDIFDSFFSKIATRTETTVFWPFKEHEANSDKNQTLSLRKKRIKNAFNSTSDPIIILILTLNIGREWDILNDAIKGD